MIHTYQVRRRCGLLPRSPAQRPEGRAFRRHHLPGIRGEHEAAELNFCDGIILTVSGNILKLVISIKLESLYSHQDGYYTCNVYQHHCEGKLKYCMLHDC